MGRKNTKWVCFLCADEYPYKEADIDEVYGNIRDFEVKCLEMQEDKKSKVWKPVMRDLNYIDIPTEHFNFYAVGDTLEEAEENIQDMVERIKKDIENHVENILIDIDLSSSVPRYS